MRRWRSSGFSLPSGPKRSEILLGLLPELALAVLVAGAAFFWSLFLGGCCWLDFELPACWLPDDLSLRLSDEVDLFWEVEGFAVEVDRLSLLISDWRSQ
jgi:hypothetical protein